MKKYVKPELFFEKYELSQHIADCTWNMTYNTDGTCKGTAEDKGFGQLTVFAEDCDVPISSIQDYCITNGADNKVLFVS